jgi:hypothetical protein
VNGSRPSSPPSTTTPSPRRPATIGPIGRSRARGSPSNATSPVASAATGGRKRMTVPARPQSTAAGPASGAGVTSQSSPNEPLAGASTTCVPSDASAAAMSTVSRERSGARNREGSADSAASTRYRFVSDFEPGSATVAPTGPSATGAGQSVAVVTGTPR